MRYRSPAAILLFLLGLLLLTAMMAMSLGAVKMSPGQVAAVLAGRASEQLHIQVVLQVRAPRIVAAGLVGSALAAAGAAMQSLFRNPMADPGIIGVSAGGAVGGVIAMTSGLYRIVPLSLPAAAFAGALTAALLVYTIANRIGNGSVTDLLLTGMAVSSFLGGVLSLIITWLVYELEVLREIVHWMTGGFDARSWYHVRLIIGPVLLGQAVLIFLARPLNLLTLGDEEAKSLGVQAKTVRRIVLAAASLITGAAVSISGIIGFVGLMVPHMLRLAVGPDQRLLIPASGLGGATFLIIADTVARTVIQPAEIRVGIITACIGAPFFLFLLYRHRRMREI